MTAAGYCLEPVETLSTAAMTVSKMRLAGGI